MVSRVCSPHLLLGTLFLFSSSLSAAAQSTEILTGAQLAKGFDMGVNSSGGRTDWLHGEGTQFRMSYPAGQSWGAVFITVGKPRQTSRPSQDFSHFDSLTIELRGETGGEHVEIGVKSNMQPDDGLETRVSIQLTKDWKIYPIALERFSDSDLAHLYVVTEFVFTGPAPQTIYARKVLYTRNNPNGTQKESPQHEGSPNLLSTPPHVSISQPADQQEINMVSGPRPSIFVKGSVDYIPENFKLFLVVHPVQNDEFWAQEIPVRSGEWAGQAYLGDQDTGLFQDGSVFQIMAITSEAPPPTALKYPKKSRYFLSNIVNVRLKLTSWLDRLVAYAKDVQVFAPIAALFTALGTLISKMLDRRKGTPRKPRPKLARSSPS